MQDRPSINPELNELIRNYKNPGWVLTNIRTQFAAIDPNSQLVRDLSKRENNPEVSILTSYFVLNRYYKKIINKIITETTPLTCEEERVLMLHPVLAAIAALNKSLSVLRQCLEDYERIIKENFQVLSDQNKVLFTTSRDLIKSTIADIDHPQDCEQLDKNNLIYGATARILNKLKEKNEELNSTELQDSMKEFQKLVFAQPNKPSDIASRFLDMIDKSLPPIRDLPVHSIAFNTRLYITKFKEKSDFAFRFHSYLLSLRDDHEPTLKSVPMLWEKFNIFLDTFSGLAEVYTTEQLYLTWRKGRKSSSWRNHEDTETERTIMLRLCEIVNGIRGYEGLMQAKEELIMLRKRLMQINDLERPKLIPIKAKKIRIHSPDKTPKFTKISLRSEFKDSKESKALHLEIPEEVTPVSFVSYKETILQRLEENHQIEETKNWKELEDAISLSLTSIPTGYQKEIIALEKMPAKTELQRKARADKPIFLHPYYLLYLDLSYLRNKIRFLEQNDANEIQRKLKYWFNKYRKNSFLKGIRQKIKLRTLENGVKDFYDLLTTDDLPSISKMINIVNVFIKDYEKHLKHNEMGPRLLDDLPPEAQEVRELKHLIASLQDRENARLAHPSPNLFSPRPEKKARLERQTLSTFTQDSNAPSPRLFAQSPGGKRQRVENKSSTNNKLVKPR